MAEIINLNQFRKARQKRQRQDQAAVNRVRHGRPKSSVEQDKAERDSQHRNIDNKQLDRDDDGKEPA